MFEMGGNGNLRLEMLASAGSRCKVSTKKTTVDGRSNKEDRGMELGGEMGDDFIIPLPGPRRPCSLVPGEEIDHILAGNTNSPSCGIRSRHERIDSHKGRGAPKVQTVKEGSQSTGHRDPAEVHTPAGLLAVRTPHVARLGREWDVVDQGKCSRAWITLTGNGGQCCHK